MTQHLDTEGKRLKYIRENILGLSLEAFGTPIAKHFSAIQKWESGQTVIEPSIKLLLELVYNINPNWLNTGLGDMIFERTSLDAFVMPIYALSGKSYDDIFKKENFIINKNVLHADLTHDFASVSLIVANKPSVGIEKGDLLVISSNIGKSKSPSHYLIEDKGGLDVRLLQYSGKDGIVEIKNSKTLEVEDFPFNTEIISLDVDQFKGKVVNTIAANLWRNASVILI